LAIGFVGNPVVALLDRYGFYLPFNQKLDKDDWVLRVGLGSADWRLNFLIPVLVALWEVLQTLE